MDLATNLANLYNHCYNMEWAIDYEDDRVKPSDDLSDEESLTLAGYILYASTKYIYKTVRFYIKR